MSADAVLLEGRWRFDRVLGQGAEGTVYLAHDVQSGQPVAIKVYDTLGHDDPSRIAAQVAAEVALGRQIDSPGLVRTIAFGVAPLAGGGQTAYVVMEYLRGRTLRRFLDRVGRNRDERELSALFLDLLLVVEAMHGAGFVHLDLKPENIFVLDPDATLPAGPQIRLFDFASAAEAGVAVRARGTPFYASPEVCLRTGEIGKQSDVYSLGVMLFEALVGRPPIAPGTAEQIVAVHAFGQLEPWPATLDRSRYAPVYRRATLREPWQRWPDAGAMRRAILVARGDVPG
jgi:serine/threonine protein kinase